VQSYSPVPELMNISTTDEHSTHIFYIQALGPKAAAQSTYHREASAILEAIKRWRHYFLGGKLVIITDQHSLKFMMTQRLSRRHIAQVTNEAAEIRLLN
jgi:predicted Zn-dependent protease